MEPIRAILSRNLKAIRAIRGFSQQDLSELSGVSQQYLSGLETGKRNATIETTAKLAEVLGITAADLLREPGSD